MIILALASAIVAEPPMVPAFFTADKLYKICRQEDDAQCLMYVAGALDGIFYVRFSDREVQLCPSEMTNRQAADLLVGYLDKNPEARKLAGAAAVRQAMEPRLQCKAPQVAMDE